MYINKKEYMGASLSLTDNFICEVVLAGVGLLDFLFLL